MSCIFSDEITFAGVRFMAESAKLLKPDATVILPESRASCSLVEDTNIDDLKAWSGVYDDHVHVAYINSSIEHKAVADIIVTSRIVDDVIKEIYSTGRKAIFSPDYNMGAWLNQSMNIKMPLWHAVCEVHDAFSMAGLQSLLLEYPDACVIAHPESGMGVLHEADYVGSTKGMLDYIKGVGLDSIVIVATEDGLLYNMRELRPDVLFIQSPVYKGCQCASCPYMKMNTVENVLSGEGEEIIIDSEIGDLARLSVERMFHFTKTGKV